MEQNIERGKIYSYTYDYNKLLPEENISQSKTPKIQTAAFFILALIPVVNIILLLILMFGGSVRKVLKGFLAAQAAVVIAQVGTWLSCSGVLADAFRNLIDFLSGH